jgi:hypothetical protein
MRFGIYVGNCLSFASVTALRRLATEAEAAGWDGFFIWDHMLIAEDVPVIDAQVALAAIAAATAADGPIRRIGALVTPLARRRPWKFAREIAALQELSEGRMVVGVGLGDPTDFDFASTEADTPKERARALDDSLELLGRFWSGEGVSWSRPAARGGDQPGAPSVEATPFLPVPWPAPPIWVAGSVFRDDEANAPAPVLSADEYRPRLAERSMKQPTRPFRRAARHQGLFPLAVPWDNSAPLTAAELERAIRLAFPSEPPPPGYDVVVTGRASGPSAPTTAAELAKLEEAGATWWLEAPDDMASLDEAIALVRNGPPPPARYTNER